jgi:hypothetical protein
MMTTKRTSGPLPQASFESVRTFIFIFILQLLGLFARAGMHVLASVLARDYLCGW